MTRFVAPEYIEYFNYITEKSTYESGFVPFQLDEIELEPGEYRWIVISSYDSIKEDSDHMYMPFEVD